MNRASLLSAAWLADHLAGDPEWFPHPVRLIGLAIDRGDQALRRPGQSSTTELLAGAALTFTIVAATYAITRELIRQAHKQSPPLGDATELTLAWTCLAARNLHDETTHVVQALAAHDLVRARPQLARIVGRDTAHLDESEICRAVIETLAESASDGIMAPIFYMAVGGVPAAMAYKAINTLDSMIGHADQRYFYFGKATARLDDLANLIPSRLTAAAIVLTAALKKNTHAGSSLATWLRDGNKHKSPNAGQPESAIAGALHTRLGGSNTYAGERIDAPIMGADYPAPNLAQAKQAIRIITLVTLIGIAAATTATYLLKKAR